MLPLLSVRLSQRHIGWLFCRGKMEISVKIDFLNQDLLLLWSWLCQFPFGLGLSTLSRGHCSSCVKWCAMKLARFLLNLLLLTHATLKQNKTKQTSTPWIRNPQTMELPKVLPWTPLRRCILNVYLVMGFYSSQIPWLSVLLCLILSILSFD
jgi:hypothetical protein